MLAVTVLFTVLYGWTNAAIAVAGVLSGILGGIDWATKNYRREVDEIVADLKLHLEET